jgi:opacity protein-like surface antigen
MEDSNGLVCRFRRQGAVPQAVSHDVEAAARRELGAPCIAADCFPGDGDGNRTGWKAGGGLQPDLSHPVVTEGARRYLPDSLGA